MPEPAAEFNPCTCTAGKRPCPNQATRDDGLCDKCRKSIICISVRKGLA